MRQYFYIERIDAPATFFSEKIGRDVGAPGNGWTRDRPLASKYETRQLALARVAQLGFMTPFVKIESHVLAFDDGPEERPEPSAPQLETAAADADFVRLVQAASSQ